VSLALAALVVGSALAAAGFAGAVVSGIGAVSSPAEYVEPCRNCDPESGSDRYCCVACRPELGLIGSCETTFDGG
jgi:hypothetical protein